jgi:alkanesulfonate monooxygenase SsuD/methylene tetrahydromethanopterin reductase-like flavin-dependent oxidoreductase (luciferase family)
MVDGAGQPVRFGYSLPNRAVVYGLPAEVLLEAADLAESCPLIDSIWTGDNFLFTPRLEAIVLLSAVAGRTKRVRLGTICLASFPLRNPIELAIQWGSLDRLSGGRTILAVCIGRSDRDSPSAAAELAAFGVPSRERVVRMEEGIELLRRFWGQGPVTFEGRVYRYENVHVLPKPAQARVPIVIAGLATPNLDPKVEERALRRTALLSDGWQTSGIPLALFRERWARIRGYAAEYGRSDQVVEASLHTLVNINDNRERAWDETVEWLARYYGEGAVSRERMEEWLAYGTPDDVITKLRRVIEVGCTTPVLRFTSLNQVGQLQRCVREVLPAFEGAVAAQP